MWKKNNRRFSLTAQTAAVVLLAAVLVTAVFYLTGFLCEAFIQNFYLADSRCMMRTERYLNEFTDFVEKKNISVNDMESVHEWCHDKKYVWLTVYRYEDIYYYTDGTDLTIYSSEEAREMRDQIDYNSLYTVKFVDELAYIEITECSEYAYYNVEYILRYAAALLVACAVMLLFTSKLVKRIITLSRELDGIRSGNLEASITCEGNDELSQLALSADDMRKSIISHYEGEKEAWNANKELVMSMSHDIRTPLTSLLVYSDLLAQDDSGLPKEERKKYLNICREKAYQLKGLTDDLFRYFLVYTDEDIQTDIKSFGSEVLFSQLIGERLVFLQQKGYSYKINSRCGDCDISADAQILNRVFDNVFSNIEKHGEDGCLIEISTTCDEDFITVEFCNKINTGSTKAESTKIGLKTCEKLMQLLGGKFYTKTADGLFICRVSIKRVTK